MKAKEILAKLKLALMDDYAPSGEVKAELMTAQLADGTEITYDRLEVGGMVMIGMDAAPVGEHTLMDGTVIVLADNGIIESIVPVAEVAEVEDPSAIIEARFAAIEKNTNEKFAAYESKFAAYEAKLNKANTVIEGLLGLTQLLVEQPQAAADAAASVQNTKFKKEDPKEYLNTISNVFFTKKNK